MQCTLTGDLTIGAAAEAKQQLLHALAGEGPLELDTREVTEVDDGGALSSSGPVSVSITQPIAYSAEIVNTFATTTTTAPGATPAAPARRQVSEDLSLPGVLTATG